MRGQLLVVAGPDQGRTFAVEEGQTLVVGRGHNTGTQLKDAQVSRVHCHARLVGGRLRLNDPGSTTGTLVGGRRVVEYDLAPGETFQVGATTLRFQAEVGADATTVVTAGDVPGALAAYLPEPQYQHLRARSDGDVLVLTLTDGQILDDEAAEAVRVEMLAAVGRAGVRKVVVDFQAVTSASESVVRPVSTLHARLQETGGGLILCGLTGMPAQVLRMSGLTAAGGGVETAADAGAAVARLGQELSP